MAEQKVTVQVGQRRMALSNPDKPLYPNGFTKGEVVRYYTCIAPVLLPHLRGRPVTFVRWPEGTTGEAFFEKDLPLGGPITPRGELFVLYIKRRHP
ncbi:hypothetical protein AB0F91_44785 [Amycolatopsis sp. NPDC023774]|uniref:non-homologous end-joining DNA ligase LigD n=1 Tax=Amycolatopsis sp. NPDC023774 TaxID=3155015 RepID=UPI003407846F